MEYNANGNGVAARVRDLSPERRRLGCWSWVGGCLGKQKRAKQIVPAARSQDGSAGTSRTWVANGAVASATSDHFPGLSPSLLAPPSSPASIANSGNPSSVQSPAGFTVSLSVASASACSPVGLRLDRTATMFTIGPYANETALVTPPVFSAFTTPPSTAPFTPPPELAHLTTPSSPDVPYAQFLASSPKENASRDRSTAQHSASLLTSSDDVTFSEFNQLYPESPITQLVSPNSGASGSEPSSPLPGAASPKQQNIGQVVANSKQETSFLVLKQANSSSLNLEISASKSSFPTYGYNPRKNGRIQSFETTNNLYFHQHENDLARSKPEWHADCISGKQDYYKDMGMNIGHVVRSANNSKSEFEYGNRNDLKERQSFRDMKDLKECQKLQQIFSEDLFTRYNFNSNAKSGHSPITSCVQNLLHPSVKNKEHFDVLERLEGHRNSLLCGDIGTAVDCNFESSGTFNESEVFELGSKDLKHTLSNKSMSFFSATEMAYPRNFDAMADFSGGASEMTPLDSYLDVPRISFSTPELLLSTSIRNTDMNPDESICANICENIREFSRDEVLSSSGNVPVDALEQQEDASSMELLKNEVPSSGGSGFVAVLEQTNEASSVKVG